MEHNWRNWKMKPFYEQAFICDALEDYFIGENEFVPYHDFHNIVEINLEEGISSQTHK